MNRTVLLLLFLYLVPAAGRGQAVNFEDGFEDGDFTSGPAWEGDAARFRVTPAGGGHLLQLDSPDTEDAFLSTPSASVEGYWEIYVRFDGFLPSASNRAEIFLMSDAADLEGPVNGYALQAGQSGDDFFKIVRYDGGVQEAVVLEDTTLVTGNADGYRIRVERTAGGEWDLLVARGYLEKPVSAGPPSVDATHLSATHFGVRVRYTSTRSDRFYFDFKIDPPPFFLENIAARADRLELRFSRVVDPSSVTAGDFTLTPDPGAAPSVDFPSPETVALGFPDSLASARYHLRLGEVRDAAGQVAANDTLYSFILYGRASPGELLLNEFAWDPPGSAPEFVEIINAGPQVLNLAGWRLGDSGRDALVSGDTLPLFAGERMALTSDSAALASAYPAHGPIHPVPSLAALNNSGDALRLISPGGWTTDSLSYSPDWGGADGSLERRSLRLAARFRENWGPAPGSPPGSPGRANAVAPDTLPPEVRSFRMLSDRRAELLFTERLDSSTALDPAHVTVGAGPDVSQLLFFPPDTLRLELSSPLRSNSEYTFAAEGLCDLFGNCSARWDTTFRWQVIETARQGELFLNEFAYDPPAGWSEYVELYNGSGKTFSAGRLTLEDERGKPVPLSVEPVLILPGAFLVIAPDEALRDSFPGIPLLSMGSVFPALNNAGDRIVIRNEEGGAVDSLRYESGWGGKEAALERRSLDHPAHAPWNWTEAAGTRGGTPGAKNSVGADTQAPRLSGLRTAGPLALELTFTEELAEGPAGNAGNYRLEGGPAISAAAFRRPDTVLLHLEAPLLHKRSYTLRWRGVADHFGNASQGDTAFTHIDYPLPAGGDLLVSEFMYDPPGGWTEYVELYNASGREMSVAGISLSDAGGGRAALSDSTWVLGAGEYLVLAPDETLRELYPGIPLASLGSRFPALNNGGDRIVIRNREGEMLDSLRYSRDWGGEERALERRSLDHPAHARWNWAEASETGGGTPGARNSAGPDTQAPRLADLRTAGPLALELLFTEELAESPAGDAGNYRLVGGPAVTAAALHPPDTVLLHLEAPLLHKRSYTLRWRGVADHFGNASQGDTAFVYLDYPPARAGDLLINEFMYDPPADWGEFVELVNRSSREVALQGTRIADAAGNVSVLSDSALRLGAGEFLVLTPDSRLRALFPEIPLLALGSRFPVLNNGGDAIVVQDREGVTGDSLFYSPSWGGAKTSLERRSPDLSAVVPYNWSDSPPESPGSPGRANRAGPDRTPPRLLALEVLSGSSLELLFSERLDTLAVRREGRFTLNPGGGISRLRFPAADRLLLSLHPPLEHLRRYNLSWRGVSDPWHNTTPGDTAFTHIDYPVPAEGELLVSEFMYDPPEGWTEYVELYNAAGREMSVAGISLSDAGGGRAALSDSTWVLGAGEYLVLAPDKTLRELYPGITLASLGSRFPALNNGGDRIVIRNREGEVLDSLRYSREWGGREVALERRSFSHPPTFGENWAESDGPGTPGLANSAGPDTTPPELLKAEAAGGEAVSLLFSERLDEKSVSKERFRFAPGRAIGEIRAAGDSLALHLDEPLESGTEYLLSLEGLGDLFGNLMEPTERSLLYIKISPAERGDLVISEFLHLPEEGRDREFVEIHNRSDKNVELAGWSLEDAVSSALIRESHVLRSGRRVVLTSTASPAGHYPGAVRLPSFPSLNNSTDRIALRDGRGRAIDSLSYGGRDWPVKNGHSMERKDPLSASGDPANWEPSRSPGGHTAGTPNSVEGPDRDPPHMLFARLREGALEVDFNEFIRPDSLTAFWAGGLPLAIARYLPERANRLTLRLPGDEKFLPGPGRLTLAAENFGDYRGNRTSREEVPIAFPPLPGDLAINEIMYRPIARPGDNLPDQSEYVELWNTSGHSLSLEGLRLRGERDENGHFAPLLPARSRHRRVAAGEPALLYADTAGSFGSSRTARYFRLEEADGKSLLRFDRLTLNLGEAGALLLADSGGTVVDSVRYSPDWHNPALADNRGISLEKIDPVLPGHHFQSWGSSAAPLGGTPLGENSIYAGSPQGGEREGLTLAPDPFSPDGDGHEDHLLIAYRLNRPDYLIRVRIYDRYGRLVRTLADGRRAGPEGSLVWDGLSDDRRSNRIGIYIITLEAYNAVSGARQAFRKTAVLARRLKSP